MPAVNGMLAPLCSGLMPSVAVTWTVLKARLHLCLDDAHNESEAATRSLSIHSPYLCESIQVLVASNRSCMRLCTCARGVYSMLGNGPSEPCSVC